MHWRDRFLYVMDAREQGERGHRRGEGPLPQRHRRRRWKTCTSAPSSPRSSARVIVMIDLVIGYTAIQSMANWARKQRHDPAPAPRRPRHLHAAEEPRRELPRHRQVDAPGRRGPHPRRHGGGQARRRPDDGAGLLQRLPRQPTRKSRPAARPVLRPGLGRPEEGDAGGLGRHPRRPDAPAARPASATTWCCSSAAARSATRRASRPARWPTAWRSRRWSRRATKAATSRTKARRSCRRRRSSARR